VFLSTRTTLPRPFSGEKAPRRWCGRQGCTKGGITTRYTIGPDVVLRLALDGERVPHGHQLVAPALLRSQLVSQLYQAVRRDEMTKPDADRVLDHMRALRIRLLGDRVLQAVAWKVADALGWPDTFTAEYVAVTQLQADALVTLDPELADAVKALARTASYEELVAAP
jgi:predicted nucleic acid-binding protein